MLMDAKLYEISVEAIRALFLIGAPILVAAVVAGLVMGAVQSATSIQDRALGYAAKLSAVVAMIYVMLPAIDRSFRSLAETAFR